jgi:choline dehydrogenase-like flavoprotein
MTPHTPAERNLRALLRLLAVLFGAVSIFFSLILPQSGGSLMRTAPGSLQILGVAYPPLWAEAGAGFGLLAFMAWLASGDVRRFRSLMMLVGAGCTFGALGSLYYVLTGYSVVSDTNWFGWMIVFAMAAAALWWSISHTPPSQDTVLPYKAQQPTTLAEGVTTLIISVISALLLAAGLLFLVAQFVTVDAVRGQFVPSLSTLGAALLMALMAGCGFMLAAHPRRDNEYAALLFIGALLALLGVAAAILRGSVLQALYVAPEGTNTLNNRLLIFAALAVGLWLLRGWLNRSVLPGRGYFTPGQFWSLAAISDGLISGGTRELLKPHEIAKRVDTYLSSFPAPKLVLSRYALFALDLLIPFLFGLRPPLSYMSLEERTEFLNKHFKEDIIHKRGIYRVFALLRWKLPVNYIEGVMRLVMQFAYLGYYSDEKVQETIGYQPFSQRAAERGIPLTTKRHASKPLSVLTPRDVERLNMHTLHNEDVVIIGSGAAGALIAENMLKAGRRVLLLEKGKHVDTETFNEDEVDMIGKLYGDNALQVSSALNFTILQGSCVGGTTVSNNAVSFKTPEPVLKQWNDEYGAEIDTTAYDQAQDAVIARMKIKPVDATASTRPAHEIVNPVSHRLQAGIDAVLGERGYDYGIVQANMDDCLGCGYCNTGCKYGRKLSMLDTVLPQAQEQYGDQLRIVSEAHATGLRADGDRIAEIQVKLSDGKTMTIRNPKTVIVSGGAVASSWLLKRSGIGANLPIGRRLCFNMGSPLHARFPEPINAYDGLQISHYLQIPNEPGFIFETWFNPPVAEALVMPGWLDKHFENMLTYNRIAAMGVVVGTDARKDTYIRKAALFPSTAEVVYTPSKADLDRLVDAMITMGKVLLASGAEAVFASTRRYHSYIAYQENEPVGRAQSVYRSEEELVRFLRKLVQDDSDILLSTAHPQGGNPLGKVLDEHFRVRGYRNLYVCDASVFPTSVTVNPQLTVMALAQYASGVME